MFKSNAITAGPKLLRAISVTIIFLSFSFKILAQNPAAQERYSSLKSLPFLSFFPESLRVNSGDGGEVKLIVTSNRKWVFRCSEKWFSSDSVTGYGFNEVIIKALENPESYERTAKIVIKTDGLPDKTVILSQKARHDE